MVDSLFLNMETSFLTFDYMGREFFHKLKVVGGHKHCMAPVGTFV